MNKALLLITAAILSTSCATSGPGQMRGPLSIQQQGSFAVGGRTALKALWVRADNRPARFLMAINELRSISMFLKAAERSHAFTRCS